MSQFNKSFLTDKQQDLAHEAHIQGKQQDIQAKIALQRRDQSEHQDNVAQQGSNAKKNKGGE